MKEYFEWMDDYFERLNRAESSSWRCHLNKKMLNLLETTPELQKVWKYDGSRHAILNRWIKIEYSPKENSSKRKTIKLSETIVNWGGIDIHFLNDCQIKDNTIQGEKTYLFRFYNKEKLIFSKIGTTTKTCQKRLKDEIRYYDNRGFDIRKVEMCEIIDCGEVPAESYESYLRALLIKKFPNTWHKNDRFFGINIPIELFNKICMQYNTILNSEF